VSESQGIGRPVALPWRGDGIDVVVLPASPSSVWQARRFVAHHLAPFDNADAGLVVSELVTNALVHCHGEVRLTIAVDPACLRIEVWDRDGDALPQLRQAQSGRAGGRGLHIMRAVCVAWGYHREGLGKTVWGELGRIPTPTPPSSPSRY
jgi:anti-sigma regulatory factor (Ser/Thr protein kinase)